MIVTLSRMVLLGIEIEVFILLLILIRENIFEQSKRKRHCSKSLSRKDDIRYKNTASNPTVGAEQSEHLPHPSANPSELDLTQEVIGTPAIPDISPDAFPEDDVGSFMHLEDTRSKISELSIEKKFVCGIKDTQSINSYSSQAQLVEKEQGDLIVVILDDGSILGIPSGEITTERRLNDVFRLFFDFSMPNQPYSKKFRITCENAAELIKDSQAFCLKTKGRLRLDAV